ncbi:SPOR domain-containing protein [Haloimpatiens lingqiaonensis]|uniref:SPOR domain-containing protein n=1 Tax=Haloimpatiens lingqiaonensis TaxID=1380675 RepID=UPI0010FDB823|nr:SPOR domain-containing protein [Haloimpatiens lingqiaonensis]
MKYTRYNVKRKTNKRFIAVIILLVAAMLIVIGNGKGIKILNKAENTSPKEISIKNTTGKKEKNFYAIQCGVFLSKEYADTLVNTLKPYGSSFIVKVDDKFKVILGIYKEEDLEKTVSILNKKEIQNTKLTFKIKGEDLCNLEIIELINANLDVLSQFSDKNVKAFKTEKLKKWNSSLKAVDEKSKNIQVLKSLKDYVNKLPNEISREQVSSGYNFIYNSLISIK